MKLAKTPEFRAEKDKRKVGGRVYFLRKPYRVSYRVPYRMDRDSENGEDVYVHACLSDRADTRKTERVMVSETLEK